MSTETHTEIVCIVDRSGSMNRIREDAIGGFNAFLAEQKELPDPAKLTLVLFNHRYQLLHDGVSLQDVPELDDRAYAISGNTALLDAVGMTIDNVRNRIETLSDDEEPAAVIVAILTDGLENSSREYTRQQVFELIKAQREAGWEFVFLAANQDAVSEGGRMGVDAADARKFAHTGEGVREAFRHSSARTAETRRRTRDQGKTSPTGSTKIGFPKPD